MLIRRLQFVIRNRISFWHETYAAIRVNLNPRNSGQILLFSFEILRRISWNFFCQVIIALLTDFGTRDYFVAAMKGAILSVNAQAIIVDLTHEIPPQDIETASFTLRACYKDFPAKTIFVTVIDPGVGSNRRAILVKTDSYFFAAPDNGLLSFIFDEEKDFSVFELTSKKFFNQNISRTFHGRDIFAPVAAHLSKGVEIDKLGREITDFVCFKTDKPRKISKIETEGEIIHTDNFGNIITNLTTSDLPESFVIEINDVIIKEYLEFFAQAEKGQLFMILGSAGFLEIAAFKDSAKSILNVKTGAKLLLKEVK